MHLDAVKTVPLAHMTLPGSEVKTEGTHVKSTQLCIVLFGKEFTDLREQVGIGCRIRTRCFADGFLVYVDETLDVTNASDALILR